MVAGPAGEFGRACDPFEIPGFGHENADLGGGDHTSAFASSIKNKVRLEAEHSFNAMQIFQ